MSDSKTPLRTPFKIIEIGKKGTYSVYRRILPMLGLTTERALDAFFTQFKSKTKVDVDAIMEEYQTGGDEPDVACAELPYTNFLYGGQNIAVFDDPEFGVTVAHRVGRDIHIHHVGELFLNLVDSFRLSTARAFCPKLSYPVGFQAASCINCLNALLGLGYRVVYDGMNVGVLVVVAPGTSERCVFEVPQLTALVISMLNNSQVSDLTNPEWVFGMLQKWNSEKPQMVAMSQVEA